MIELLLLLAQTAPIPVTPPTAVPSASSLSCEMQPGKMPDSGAPAKASVESARSLPPRWSIEVATPSTELTTISYSDPVVGKSLSLPYKWLTRANYGGSGFADGKAKGERWTVYYSILFTDPGEALVSVEYTRVRKSGGREVVTPLSAHGQCRELVHFTPKVPS